MASYAPLGLPGLRLALQLSSAAIRILSFIFLRWIPGHPFPPLIITLSVIYAGSYYFCRTENGAEKPTKLVVGTRKPNGEVSLTYTGKHVSDDESEDEDTVYGLRDWESWKVLLSGVPKAGAKAWNFGTVVINALLVLMVMDLTFSGPIFYPSHDLSFARVGYVNDRSAKILIREPNKDQFPLFLSYRKDSENSWTPAEKLYTISEDSDYTHVTVLPNLRQSTRYEYSVSNGHSGSFRTAPRVGKLPKDTSRFTFLTSSCIKPRFPYNPLDHTLRIPGLEYVSTLASSLQASFMMFLGDFIYIDVPFRFGSKPDTYRGEYRRVYNSPSWQAAGKDLPWLHVIDDHEIANDWDKGWESPYPAAIDPFNIYHHSVNPTPIFANTTYYSFKQGPASFFMVDSRRYRSKEFDLPADHPSKTMLGQAQLEAVLEWLRDPEPQGVNWKILVSSIPLTRNWKINAQDTWSGYLVERQMLLEAMWDASSGPRQYGVIILSGDRHEFAATRFPAPEENEEMRLARRFGTGEVRWAPGVAVYEFSCSPLNMFYLPVRTYWENPGEHTGVSTGGEDQVLAYIPDGNSKIGAVEIENALGSAQSILRYRLFVDGKESWSYVITSGEEKGAAGKQAIWS